MSARAILVTQYFPPEPGAGSRRARALARFLQEVGCDVTVMTGMPNYPSRSVQEDHKRKVYQHRIEGELDVIRVRAPGVRFTGLISRSIHEIVFAFLILMRLCLAPSSDLVIVTVPSPFLAMVGRLARILRRTRNVVTDVRDLTFRYASEQGGMPTRSLALSLHRGFCRLVGRSDRVTTTSHGIRDALIADGVNPDRCEVLLNGVDELPAVHQAGNPDPIRIVYAGLVGRAQGVERLADVATAVRDLDFVIDILGDGPCMDELVAAVEREDLGRMISISGMVALDDVSGRIAAADIAVVTLRDEIGAGALPTKILDAMASSKPVLFIGSGEGAALVRRARCGSTAPWSDVAGAADALRSLISDAKLRTEAGDAGRRYVEAHLTRHALLTDKLLPILKGLLPDLREGERPLRPQVRYGAPS